LRYPWLVLLILCWCVFLALQEGDVFDESEHAHVAWLMEREHQLPIHDFFQHHQPLLWDVLRLYYRFGGDGPEVLYLGRGLVVLCALVICLACIGIARKTGLLAILALVLVSVAFPAFFVSRPDTLGLAAFLLAVLVWLPGKRADGPSKRWQELGRDFLSGLCFGVAVFASPRFVLLAGYVILLEKDAGRLFFLRPAALMAWVLGGILFVVGYLLFTGYPIADVRFNLDASGVLAKVGPGYFSQVSRMLLVGVLVAGALVWVHSHLAPAARQRCQMQVLYGALVLAASLLASWPYLYPQNLFAPVAWLVVVLAVAESQLDLQQGSARGLIQGGVAVAVVICLLVTLGHVLLDRSILAQVAAKRELLHVLRPGEKVILASRTHPICVGDASYYANPITDAEDRLAETVRRLQPRWPQLPECDYLRDIREQKPVLLDGFMFAVLPAAQHDALREILTEDYEPLFPEDTSGSPARAIFRRKDVSR
jgi:hypothetical protein